MQISSQTQIPQRNKLNLIFPLRCFSLKVFELKISINIIMVQKNYYDNTVGSCCVGLILLHRTDAKENREARKKRMIHFSKHPTERDRAIVNSVILISNDGGDDGGDDDDAFGSCERMQRQMPGSDTGGTECLNLFVVRQQPGLP